MPRKLNKFEQDILSLLKGVEPDMLLWREIKARLWPSYKKIGKYPKSGERGFGVVVSNKLNRLADLGYIKKNGDYWGTRNAIARAKESQSSIILRLLSGIVMVVFYVLIWTNLRPEVYPAVNVLNSTLTATHKQAILLAVESYPFVIVLVVISELFCIIRSPKHPPSSLSGVYTRV